MFRILAVLAAVALAGSPRAESAQGRPFDRRATLALIEHDLLREDSRVFLNRERGETIEAALVVGAQRYGLALERPSGHEFLLVIEARDGARCPGLQTIIVGTRTGRLYQGTCPASIAVNSRTHRAYYEAELDRLLRVFHPLLAPHAPRREES
ncbi:MAG TPA: hypothetical protein VIF14_18030 [Alphaproteobacteria bacterium]|jgi:hypothetical protein